MYTNGILMTREIAGQLAEAGLDEIRFDIGATGYNCHKIAAAKGIIPVISVEIPAVPEALPILKQLLPELPQLGVQHLNLHQMRLTQHNFKHLNERGYTFLHGEKVTVLDSELTALEILSFVHRNQLSLPVNYCSFVFKHRHQKAAARRRTALFDRGPLESVTQAGFLRKMALCGDPSLLNKQVALWQQSGQDETLWKFRPDQSQLQISPRLLPLVHWPRLRLSISYDQVQMTQKGDPKPDDTEIPLEPGPVVRVARRSASAEILLGPTAARQFADTWLTELRPETLPQNQRIFSEWEVIPEGLQRYS
jgi:hypothetical protein